jgi:hypothetical protein
LLFGELGRLERKRLPVVGERDSDEIEIRGTILLSARDREKPAPDRRKHRILKPATRLLKSPRGDVRSRPRAYCPPF